MQRELTQEEKEAHARLEARLKGRKKLTPCPESDFAESKGLNGQL